MPGDPNHKFSLSFNQVLYKKSKFSALSGLKLVFSIGNFPAFYVVFVPLEYIPTIPKLVSTGVGPSAEYRAPNFNFKRLPNVEILCSNSHRKIINPCEQSE